MPTLVQSKFHLPLPAFTPGATQTEACSDLERLALALLQAAQCFEVEAGFLIRVTPSLSVDGLASLAGIEPDVTGDLLHELLSAGSISRRGQRLVLCSPEALYKLALGGSL